MKRLTELEFHICQEGSAEGYGRTCPRARRRPGRGGYGRCTGGRGDQPKSEDQPHAKQIAHALQPEMWSADAERKQVPITSDGERPLSDARGKITGRTEGQQECA